MTSMATQLEFVDLDLINIKKQMPTLHPDKMPQHYDGSFILVYWRNLYGMDTDSTKLNTSKSYFTHDNTFYAPSIKQNLIFVPQLLTKFKVHWMMYMATACWFCSFWSKRIFFFHSPKTQYSPIKDAISPFHTVSTLKPASGL